MQNSTLRVITGLLIFSMLFAVAAQKTGAADKPIRECRIMVVVPEHHIARPVPDPAGETEVIRQLVKHGLYVVDQSVVAKIRYDKAIELAQRDPDEARKIARQFGADVIIIGEAFSEWAGSSSVGITCRARFEARAIRTADGKILFADNKSGSGLDIAELVAGKTALKNAASEWVGDCIAVIDPRKSGTGGGGEPPAIPGKKSLAVVGFVGASGYANGLSDVITDMVITAFINKGGFDLVDRQQMSKILDEQRLSVEGVTDSVAAKLGGLAKADYVLVGRVSKFAENTTGIGPFALTQAHVGLSARITEVSSGKILSSVDCSGQSSKVRAGDGPLKVLIEAGGFGKSCLGEATQKAVNNLVASMGSPCPKCGELNPSSAKFCKSCGASMSTIINCPKCGKPIPADAKFCPECGQQL